LTGKSVPHQSNGRFSHPALATVRFLLTCKACGNPLGDVRKWKRLVSSGAANQVRNGLRFFSGSQTPLPTLRFRSTNAIAAKKRWLYIGRQIRPNQSGPTRTLNGGDFVVAKDWLSKNGSFNARGRKRMSYCSNLAILITSSGT
jgi:hypothetical protein